MDAAARAALRSLARSRRIQAIGANGACQFRFAVRTRRQLDLDPRLLPLSLQKVIGLTWMPWGDANDYATTQAGRSLRETLKNRPNAGDTDRIMMLRSAGCLP
jgi:hypothetical protein